jgi:hypothetical protein
MWKKGIFGGWSNLALNASGAHIGACIQKLFIALVVLQSHIIVVVKIPAFMLRHAAVIKFRFYECIKSPHKISQKRRSLRAGVIRVLLSSPASSQPPGQPSRGGIERRGGMGSPIGGKMWRDPFNPSTHFWKSAFLQ